MSSSLRSQIKSNQSRNEKKQKTTKRKTQSPIRYRAPKQEAAALHRKTTVPLSTIGRFPRKGARSRLPSHLPRPPWTPSSWSVHAHHTHTHTRALLTRRTTTAAATTTPTSRMIMSRRSSVPLPARSLALSSAFCLCGGSFALGGSTWWAPRGEVDR